MCCRLQRYAGICITHKNMCLYAMWPSLRQMCGFVFELQHVNVKKLPGNMHKKRERLSVQRGLIQQHLLCCIMSHIQFNNDTSSATNYSVNHPLSVTLALLFSASSSNFCHKLLKYYCCDSKTLTAHPNSPCSVPTTHLHITTSQFLQHSIKNLTTQN